MQNSIVLCFKVLIVLEGNLSFGLGVVIIGTAKLS